MIEHIPSMLDSSGAIIRAGKSDIPSFERDDCATSTYCLIHNYVFIRKCKQMSNENSETIRFSLKI